MQVWKEAWDTGITYQHLVNNSGAKVFDLHVSHNWYILI